MKPERPPDQAILRRSEAAEALARQGGRRDLELGKELKRLYKHVPTATVEYAAFSIDSAVRIADRGKKHYKVGRNGIKIKTGGPTLAEALERLTSAATSADLDRWSRAWLETPTAAKDFIGNIVTRNGDVKIALSGRDVFGTPIPSPQTIAPFLSEAARTASTLGKRPRSNELGASIVMAFARLSGRAPKLSGALLQFISKVEEFYGIDFRLRKGPNLIASVAEARRRLEHRG